MLILSFENFYVYGSCHLGDHGLIILHQYLCRDKAKEQGVAEISISDSNLTGASSHLIGDIISHLQPHTLQLYDNNITNVRDISAAVIFTSAVKVLDIRDNGLMAQQVMAISDMMVHLEELDVGNNKLCDHGAELLAEGITNTKTLRMLDIINNNIGSSGITAIANTYCIEKHLTGGTVHVW